MNRGENGRSRHQHGKIRSKREVEHTGGRQTDRYGNIGLNSATMHIFCLSLSDSSMNISRLMNTSLTSTSSYN